MTDLLVVGQTLQDGVGDGGGDLVHLVDAAVAGLSLHHTASQVDPGRGGVHHQCGDLWQQRQRDGYQGYGTEYLFTCLSFLSGVMRNGEARAEVQYSKYSNGHSQILQ